MFKTAKLPCMLSLALLSGAVLAHGNSVDPPAPPAPPGAPEDPRGREDADVQAQLDAAQKKLDDAARQVAELSLQIAGPYARELSKFDSYTGRAIIGVQLDPASGKDGARVVEVSPGGPAANAGMRTGDVIVSVNGKDVTGDNPPRQVNRLIRNVKPDTKLTIGAMRDGVARTFAVTPFSGHGAVVLGGNPFPELPDLPVLRPSFMMDGPLSNMELVTLSPHLGKYFGTEKGVLVVRAPPEGPLKLEDGDVIVSIDGREALSGSHATRILGSYQPGEKITLRIVRERKTMELQTTVPEATGHAHRTVMLGDHMPE